VFDKNTLGLLSVAIAAVSYVPYIRATLKRTIRPHAFSWFIWALMGLIGYAAQYVKDAGPGGWVTGFSAIVGFFIAALVFQQGDHDITRSDWVAFGGGIAAIPLWYFTKDPTASVILVTIINTVGLYPTLRKSYKRPHEEMALLFAFSGIKFLISLFALDSYSFVTMITPVTSLFTNAGTIILLLWRRRVLRRRKKAAT